MDRLILAGLFALLPYSLVFGATLNDIDFDALPGEKVRVSFKLSEKVNRDPLSFTVDDPARIVLDFPNTQSKVKKDLPMNVGVGVVKEVMAVEAMGRTRVVLNLDTMTDYKTEIKDNEYVITVAAAGGGHSLADTPATEQIVSSKPTITREPETAQDRLERNSVRNIDFRRGVQGEGRVIVKLGDRSSNVDVTEQAGRIVVDIKGARIPPRMRQRLDVTDFATPVTMIDARQIGNVARLEINAVGEYEQLAYQFDDTFTVDVKKIEEEKAVEKKRVTFGGEKISLNFQDIEIRAVLQLIADFTGLNMVAADSVKGNITLRLQNVPWDQALDIVLRTKGLGMRQTGNVIMVAPMQEIAEREKIELENMKDKEKLAPLVTRRVVVNYVKAQELAKLIGDPKNPILTKGRGSVTVFGPSNVLIIKDTAENLSHVVGLIKELDQPARQVLIESRIVIASSDFARELGSTLGLTGSDTFGGDLYTTTGNVFGTDAMINSGGSLLAPPVLNRLNWDAPATAPSVGRVALAILSNNFLVDLELSAIQAEGRGEVISSPRVITSNQKEAVIEQGQEIPYQVREVSDQGFITTSIEFKEAVLRLKVTPQITPDDRINLELDVTKDTIGEIFDTTPSIDTRQVKTNVLVSNGETVVLGGIFEQVRRDQEQKIPLLGDLPAIGMLFRKTEKQDEKNELLIFVTPKLIKNLVSTN